nr:DUF1810 domain-containing protein [Pacificimonas flava]
MERFIKAQAGVYPQALDELSAGRKRSHWMWFVFPQIAGLGQSDMARRYALSGTAEAAAYLAHPVLGARLRECLAALEGVDESDAGRVFGPVDAAKLRSSLTLFEAAGGGAGFSDALERWFGGVRDPATLERL